MAPHYWLLKVYVLARKMLVYKIFKRQQLFLPWKKSKLLLNAIRSKVSRFLSDGAGWWYRFGWKILQSALLSVPWLQPVSVAVRSCLLCVALAGHVQKRWLGAGRRKDWKREAYYHPERFHFLPILWLVLGKHLCQDDLKFSSIFQLAFFFPFNHFLAWTIFLPVCSHPCMHRQSWTSNPCQLTHNMGIQRPRTWSVFLGAVRDWDSLPRDRHTAA